MDALTWHAVRRVAVQQRLVVVRLGEEHAVGMEHVHKDGLRAAVVELEDVEQRLVAWELGEAVRRRGGEVGRRVLEEAPRAAG